jgi:hypothetical protein
MSAWDQRRYVYGDPFAAFAPFGNPYDSLRAFGYDPREESDAAIKEAQAEGTTARAIAAVTKLVTVVVPAPVAAAVADPATGEMPGWVTPVAVGGAVVVMIGTAALIMKKPKRRRNPRKRRSRSRR